MAFYDLLLGGSASDYCVPWERGDCMTPVRAAAKEARSSQVCDKIQISCFQEDSP